MSNGSRDPKYHWGKLNPNWKGPQSANDTGSVRGDRDSITGDIATQKVSCPLGNRCPHPESEHKIGSRSLTDHARIADRITARDGKMKVSLDLDGTVAGFAQGMHNTAKKLGYEVNDQFKDPTKYSMLEDGWFREKDEMKATMKELFRTGGIGEVPVLEDNLNDTIRGLQENGIEVHVVTARVIDMYSPQINKTVHDATHDWVRKHVPTADSINVVRSGEKHKIGADLYIEDAPGEIGNLKDHPLVIRNQEYNAEEHVPSEGRRRTGNIRDIFGGLFRQ